MLRRAVIVAGGAGTRLREVAPDVPKVLVEVAGEPVLARHLRLLARHGVEEVILTVGHLAEHVESWLDAHGPRTPRCTLLREERPLGTAGGLARLGSRMDESFFVLYGDVLAEVDLERLAAFHRDRGAAATLVAHPNSHPADSDLIDATTDGRIRRLLPAADRPAGDYRNLVSAAMYVLDPRALGHVRPGLRQDFVRDLFPALLTSGERLCAYRTPEYVKDLGTPERLAAVREDVAAGLPQACRRSRPRAAAFFDRDGTVNVHRGEVVSPEALELVPGAAAALRALNRAGVLTVLTTNQPMIAKGRLTWDGLEAIHARLETLLGREGAWLDAVYSCPHHPAKGFAGEVPGLKIACRCRKPAPGMFQRAMHDLPIDPARSVVIGDSWRDVEAARNAGLDSIGVLTGEGFDSPDGATRPDRTASDVAEAVESFLAPVPAGAAT